MCHVWFHTDRFTDSQTVLKYNIDATNIILLFALFVFFSEIRESRSVVLHHGDIGPYRKLLLIGLFTRSNCATQLQVSHDISTFYFSLYSLPLNLTVDSARADTSTFCHFQT